MNKFLFTFLSFFLTAHTLKPITKVQGQNVLCAKEKCKEGFLAGTLIKTVNGYKSVERIKINDYIIGPDLQGNNFARLVLNCKKKKLKEYIHILLGGQSVDIAPKQKFYCTKTKSWVCAKDLIPEHSVVTNNSDDSQLITIERIKKKVKVYRLTVEGHHLLVTPQDIVAHNASRALTQCATIALGHLTLISPIQVAVGINFDQFKSQLAQRIPALAYIEQVINAPLAKKESTVQFIEQRKLYQNIKAELLNTHKKFVTLISDIKQLSSAFAPFNKQFAVDILHNTIKDLALLNSPSAEQEMLFRPAELLGLYELRNKELNHIKEQIEQMHLNIGVYCNALIEKLELLNEEQYKACEKANFLIRQCNNNVSEVMTDCYRSILRFEKLSDELRSGLKDLKMLLHYCDTSPNAKIFKSAAYINTMFLDDTLVRDIEKNLAINVSIFSENRAHYERWLQSQNVNITNIKQNNDVEAALEKDKRQKDITKKALEQKSNSQFPKDPKKDDKKEIIQIYLEGRAREILEKILSNARFCKEVKSKIYELVGDVKAAFKDFESFQPTEIQNTRNGKMGKLGDKMINVRTYSKDGRPTLEIRDPISKKSIKIRYGNKV